MNSRDFQTNPDYPATDRVLRFVVGNDVTSTVNNGAIPSHLSDLNMPDPRSQVDQAFTFERKNGQWLINGIGFEDIANRVVAFPPQGKVQRWRLTNKSGEEVEVMANFAPWSGVYMFHCHNLVHEDHDMMAAFNVSKVDLTTFGYPDTINFIDPMAPLFRAKPITGPTDLGQIQNVLLPYFQNLDAYPDGLVIEQALKDYYKNGGPKTMTWNTKTKRRVLA
ncbi:putative Bilirubin oxidase [Glarea lozoyensis 74030]|uniref:Putative Bilirubin oxidase n=1 Tax=Glarea lozoyensis (strain ATCC 74030 / MF5533) TaxID=1104152 RepID=H0EHP1_GLAL7|nr:putative Bilirubin oxidase [Glarea lozoyensis 74030]